MRTNQNQNGALRIYSPLLLASLTALAFASFTPGPPRPVKQQIVKDINPTIKKVQQIYTSQIGVREKGNNSGSDVEQYLRYVNLSKGNPWCAAFACWVYGRAGVANPRTGWSPGMFPGTRTIFERGKHRGIENGKLKIETAGCIVLKKVYSF